jgi:hypothetical protein
VTGTDIEASLFDSKTIGDEWDRRPSDQLAG